MLYATGCGLGQGEKPPGRFSVNTRKEKRHKYSYGIVPAVDWAISRNLYRGLLTEGRPSLTLFDQLFTVGLMKPTKLAMPNALSFLATDS